MSVAGVILLCLAGTSAVAGTSAEPAGVAQTSGGQATAQKTYIPGPADDCKRYPQFATELGFKGPVYISTNLRGYPGLVFIGRDQSGGRKIYQDPTWTQAGYLAAYTYDRAGNIYVAPSPLVSLWENPPDKQNEVWKIDSRTHLMSLFASLPPVAKPSPQNPFGVMGLTYDCSNDSLYATSVMGSTPGKENGRVFRIDLKTGKPHVILEGRDFFGIGILNTRHEQRLYLGSARTSGVYAATLGGGGAPVAPPQLEFYLSNFPGGANEEAKRITFENANTLKIKGFSFHYTLTVASAYPHSEYVFRRGSGKRWRLAAVRRRLAE